RGRVWHARGARDRGDRSAGRIQTVRSHDKFRSPHPIARAAGTARVRHGVGRLVKTGWHARRVHPKYRRALIPGLLIILIAVAVIASVIRSIWGEPHGASASLAVFFRAPMLVHGDGVGAGGGAPHRIDRGGRAQG